MQSESTITNTAINNFPTRRSIQKTFDDSIHTTSSESISSLPSQDATLLPASFEPCPHTVIVGRGREPKQNMGNKRLKILASNLIKKYQHGDKKCKSKIVTDIISMIRKACKGIGAFVKHAKDGKWYDLDDGVAREKVGYIFRDLLSDQYKSSSKSKVARRQRQVSTPTPCFSSMKPSLLASTKKQKTVSMGCNNKYNANSISPLSERRMTSLGEICDISTGRIQYSKLIDEPIVPLSLSNETFDCIFEDDFLNRLTEIIND